jgi:hypothetical protein
MKCPGCGSGKTIAYYGVYRCDNCRLYFLSEEAERTELAVDSASEGKSSYMVEILPERDRYQHDL